MTLCRRSRYGRETDSLQEMRRIFGPGDQTRTNAAPDLVKNNSPTRGKCARMCSFGGGAMFLRTMIAAIALCAAASAANAENCMQYPPGPARFDCASRNHPGL